MPGKGGRNVNPGVNYGVEESRMSFANEHDYRALAEVA
jgi:hypothetical protein